MKKILLSLFAVFVLFLGCGKEGLDGKNSLLDLINEPSGVNCSSGGFKIISGVDLNNNNTLDENEVQNTEYICNGDAGNFYSDRLVRLVVGAHTICHHKTNWYISEYESYSFPDFDINNYQYVDSVIFVPTMHTNDSNYKCIVELYNITDGESIANSMIESNSTDWKFHYSKDILKSLPSKKIDLGIRIKSDTDDQQVCTGETSYLYIYKSIK